MIDKVYLLGMSVLDSGKLAINSKLDNFTEYSYADLMNLTAPNGVEYELVSEVDDDTVVIDLPIVDPTLFVSLINDIMKQDKTKIFVNQGIEIGKIFIKHLNTHSTTELSDKNVDSAIKNQVVNNVLKVARNPENQLIAQISVDAATVDLKTAAKGSHLATYEKYINSDDPTVKYVMQVQNMVGREVIGVTAVALKQFFAKTAFYNQKINDFVKAIQTNPENINTYVQRLVDLVVKENPLNGEKTVFANLNFLDALETLPNLELNPILGFTTLHDLLNWMQNTAQKVDGALSISGLLTLATDLWRKSV